MNWDNSVKCADDNIFFKLVYWWGGGGVESSWVHSALWPSPRVIMMMEKLETEILEENLPQCRFVHHKVHMLCPDANQGHRGG
jgi:hypothetical protein